MAAIIVNKIIKALFSLFKVWAVALLPVYAFGQQSLTLGVAITESMNYVAGKLPDGTKVTVLKVDAPNMKLANYITVECENYIKNNTKLLLCNKNLLPDILKRNNITDLNKTGYENVLRIAGLLGAKYVIFVEVEKHYEYYSFFMQMFDVETAQTSGIFELRVELDELLANSANEKYISSAQLHEITEGEDMAHEELVRIEKELEELKAEISAQKTVHAQNESDFNTAFSEIKAPYFDGGDTVKKSRISTSAADTQAKNNRKYSVFSLRPEYITNAKVIAIGGDIEFGKIYSNNLYFTTNLDLGIIYLGAGFNVGAYIISKSIYGGVIKNVLGITTGFWNAPIRVNVNENGNYHHVDNNMSFGGLFWKLMLGWKWNIDITNKVLFGVCEVSDYHDEVISERQFNLTYSLSAGYTLMIRKGK